jgi:hypothetical protein
MQKCHIVAFLHYEKAPKTYFLYFVQKKTKNKFLGEKGRKQELERPNFY